MGNIHYSDERNTQIIVSLLKANNIKHIVTSPGTTHMCFVGSVAHDPFFKLYSCVDERSAAYMACGIAGEIGEPVVVTCTGATASRNYYSALTEAYYRKLPIIAITAHQGSDRIGHLLDQNIDRRVLPLDISKRSVEAIWVHDKRDEHYCEIEVNKAILECTHNGGGPVHINLFTRYSRNFTVKELPPVQIIKRINGYDKLPAMISGRIAIFVGAHRKFTNHEIEAIDNFCATNDAVVFCDHTSGYWGRYGVNFALVLAQKNHECPQRNMDLLIHIGEVSGDATSRDLRPKTVWRVSEDGEIRDTWGKLSYIFEMPELYFFTRYSDENASKHDFWDECRAAIKDVYNKVGDLTLSSIWVAKQFADSLPDNSCFHMGIWSSLRSWNYFETPSTTNGSCNVGGFGIDGNLSTLIGASQCDEDRIYFGIVGDLAFFYDMNVLGNHHVGNNVRIIVINNGRGNEMRYSFSPASVLKEEGNMYLSAAGHFGNKSKELIKHFAQDLGFEYMTASTKEEVLKYKDYFLSRQKYNKPIIFEIFEDYDNEQMAFDEITSAASEKSTALKNEMKSTIKGLIGNNGVELLNSIFKK